jgi:hypothetical protein
MVNGLTETVSVQCCGTHSAMESEIPRGGMGKESLAREVLRVDVQLGVGM